MNKLKDSERIKLALMLGYKLSGIRDTQQDIQAYKDFTPDDIKTGAVYLRDLLNTLTPREMTDLRPYAFNVERGWSDLIRWGFNHPYELCKAILKVKGIDND